uniref:Glutamine cyclotransferase n=1 Tax=Odontella aurita TaxID=265563 RepID=A0A7S4IT15_9STRA|mmetsp:Transcript_29934/g.89014  ORF Transcript_29934/g.89014 Transcript_29934/m.89014 type:complete len:358 (+) Transcript_29934:210-1283(+)
MPYSDVPNADPAAVTGEGGEMDGIEMQPRCEDRGEVNEGKGGGWRSMPTATETPLPGRARWVFPVAICAAASVAASVAAAFVFLAPTWRSGGISGGGTEGEGLQQTPEPPGYLAIPNATLGDGPRFEVLSSMPHDPTSFTQGLTYADGILYESTGLNRHSKVRRVDPSTGKVLQSVDMEDKYFGEGMAYHDGKLIQITWKKNTGFVYNALTLEILRTFTYDTTKREGWGITHQPEKKRFIVSDGSAYLHFWDEDTLEDLGGKVKVKRQNGRDAINLNELEYWRGKVLANVWYEDTILVIDADTGKVESEFDFSTLKSKSNRRKENADVLNGISISEEEDVLLVTGKLWNTIYRVRLL